MGFLDLLTGRIPPSPGTAPQSPDAVARALLALDRQSAPFTVRRATPKERCDLVAEWRIVDARWYEIFARAQVSKSFTIFMRLDASARTVRALDRTASLEWVAGWPTIFAEGEVSWGRQFSREFGVGVGFTETLMPGVVYNYRFDSSEIKRPLQKTTTSSGWTWRAVGLGGL